MSGKFKKLVAVSLSDSMADKPTDSKRGSLSITVQNGNLAFVRQALMLGHYTSSTLTGTEAVVDLLIGGTMGEALAMGCYPDCPGSNQVFINTGIGRVNPLQPPKPESVIVVGLGEEGKLSAAKPHLFRANGGGVGGTAAHGAS
jgi:hypothetical protein